jgi:23S rRNA G2445 N2-methylase RlmL
MPRLFPESAEFLNAERERAALERLDRPPCPVRGTDRDASSLSMARGNARLAGMERAVQFEAADAREVTAPDSWIVTNPPYGERLADPVEARTLLDQFVRRVKHHAVGATLGLVLPRGDLEKSVGLRPEKRLAVESGPLGLRYLCFQIRAGRFTK